MSYQVDSYGNAYFPTGVSVASIPATTGTQARVLVPGANGRISSATIAQLVTQSGGNIVTSIFGRTGAVIPKQGDYTTDQITETGGALYFSTSRARKSIFLTTFNTSGPATYDTNTGILNIPQYGSGSSSVGNYVPLTRTITINGQTADLSVDRIFSVASMVYPSAGIALSNGVSWEPSITNNSVNWNTAFSWGNHAGLYSLLGHTHTFASLTSKPTTLAGYGITDAATSAQGTKADTAFGWGNHALAGYLTSFTETDPTVPSHVKAITTTNISNWNTAYTWGNHALAGYLTSFTETDPIWTSEKVNYYTKTQADGRYLQSYTETDPVWTSEKINYYTKTQADGRYLQSFTETDPIWTSEKANYALKTYVDTSISNLIDTAPTTLNTLNELAAALGDDANFSTSITTLIGTKEPAITAGTTAQYWRGDKSWQTLPIYTLSGLGGEPVITAGTTAQYWRGDKTWQTLPTYNLSLYVPYTGATANVDLGSRTLTTSSIFITGGSGTGGNLTFGQSDAFSIPNANNSSIDAVTTAFSFAVTAADSTYKYFKFETTALTNNTLRSYILPDASGTIALTSNIPTLSGLGGVPTTRSLTINGVSYDLSADRSWTISTGISGSGTTNYLSKWTGSTSVGNSVAFDNGSAIGINTASPFESSAFKLDVNGGVIIKNTSGVPAQLILIDSNPATGGNNGFVQLSAGGNTATAFGQWQTYYGTSIASGTLRLQPAGGVVLVGSTTAITGAGLFQVAGDVNISGTFRVNGVAISSGTTLNGTGFVKASGTTISYDNSTYLTTSSASSTYLPLAGGTMTGNINWGQTDRGLTWVFNTDGASIKFYNTSDGDADSRLEFATQDNNDEYFRWGHIPSGGSFYESMRLKPVSSGNAELIVIGKIIKSGGTTSQFLKANGDVDSTAYQPLLTNPITGTGTVGYIPKFTSGSAIGNSTIQEAEGGIYIDNYLFSGLPYFSYNTALAASFRITSNTNGNQVRLAFGTVSGVNNYSNIVTTIVDNSADTKGRLDFQVRSGNNSYSTALVLEHTGAATFASTVTATSFNGSLSGNSSSATRLGAQSVNLNTGRTPGTLEFYDQPGGTGAPNGNWHNYISTRHGNAANQYGFQIANEFGSEALLFRGWDGSNPLTWRTVYHSGNLTNLNQLTNGPGYITGYSETDTLGSVTGRGASTATYSTFSGGLNVAASKVGFRNAGLTEFIQGEAWTMGIYGYNSNDGFLFYQRDTSDVARPCFHIGGWNNAAYGGYSNADSMITLVRGDGTKSEGSTYATRGLSSSSYYSNIIKTTGGTIFRDSQSAHTFTGTVVVNGTGVYTAGDGGGGAGSQATIVAIRVRGFGAYESLEIGTENNYDGVIRSYGNDIRYYSGHWRTVGSTSTENHSHYWYTSKAGSTNWSTHKMRLDHDGILTVASHISTPGILHSNRNRVAFSSTATDANHSIYNNYNNIDGEGSFDGFKMNVYAGLHVRVGNASGAVPTMALDVNSTRTSIATGELWCGASNSRDNAVGLVLNDGALHVRAHNDFYHKIWYYDGIAFGTNSAHGHFRFYAETASQRGSTSGGATLRFDMDSTNGNFWAGGDVTAYSDARVKTDVKPIENSIEKIQAIRGVTFLRTDAQEQDKEKRHAGVIAQEVLEVLPEVVTENNEGMYSVAYGNLVALLIEGIKEQQLQIEELKKEIKELKK